MDLQEDRYFRALRRTLNVTRAADTCDVTQPALGRAIRTMEDELGGLLISRDRTHTHLTELGRLLRPQFEAMIAGSEAVRAITARLRRLEWAPTALGVMETIGRPRRALSEPVRGEPPRH